MSVKTILITGATSGIGEACAHNFAQQGNRLILTGRRSERLNALATALQTNHQIPVYTLVFDVQNKAACFEAIESLPTAWQNIDILINNAGLALGRDRFDKANMDDWEQMIDTNVKGVLFMSRAVLPLIQKQGAGHIINIGSIAAKDVYENGNVYCASKKAVMAISEAQRIDLLPFNIKVTCVHPGAVNTEFSLVRFKGDQQKADSVYTGYTALTGDDVASTISFVANLPSHVCINEIIITPTQQANSFYVNKKL